MKLFFHCIAASVVTALSVLADEVVKVPVHFHKELDTVVLTGEVKGHNSVVYSLPAKEGEFLTVNLRPNNRSTDFNVYVPGRSPGDEALYASALGGKLDYIGQLYKNGDHQVSVFLNRAAAREGKVSKFDIAFRLTKEKPASSTIPVDGEAPKTEVVKSDSEEITKPLLLERQSQLPKDIEKSPTAITTAVLAPSLSGILTSVRSDFDTMEQPQEVTVTAHEKGIMDDDLHGVIHTVKLLRNKNNEWRIVEYSALEERRKFSE